MAARAKTDQHAQKKKKKKLFEALSFREFTPKAEIKYVYFVISFKKKKTCVSIYVLYWINREHEINYKLVCFVFFIEQIK